MRDGILTKVIGGINVTAHVSPDGWKCDDEETAQFLKAVAPVPATEAGEPYVVAFHRAVELMGADVIQEPEPDEWPGIGSESVT